MIPMLRKELRALLPIGILGMLLMSGDVFYRPLLERHDEATWTHIADYVQPGKGATLAFVLMILAASTAFGAYPREHDERTIDFLYSLPVRKSTVFGAKVLAGLLVLLAAVGALFVTDGLQSTIGGQSLSGHQWRFDLAFNLVFLQAVYCMIVYGHALVASVLRLVGLIPYALLLLLVNILEDALPPLAWVDPAEIVVARYHGNALVIPWAGLVVHLGIALVAYVVAYVLWAGPADRVGRAFERLRASIVGKLALGCGGAAFVGFLALIAFGLLVGGGLPDEPEADDEVATFETTERRTQRYVFNYPTGLAARAQPLLDEGDALHERVRARLGAEVGPVLLADLTDTSAEHLGIAAWTHVRVGLVGERDPVRLRRTFVHETAHAFQHLVTDGRQGERGDAVRFFAEGSAEHLSYAIVPGEDELRRSRIIATATWTRHRMRFEDLAEDARLRARFDPMLVYPLGELWTEALTVTHGEGAIGEVLRAMGRDETPRGLGARAYWADTLRRAGADLEAVDATFERLVREVAEREAAAIEALPRLGGGVSGAVGSDVRITAVLDRDPPPDLRIHARVRSGPEAGDSQVVGARCRAIEGQPRRYTCDLHRALLPSSRFQILLSAQPDERGWPFSETWQWASAP